MKDFFISYNRHDKDWAEWIAWSLEENGYTVTLQAWDFRPGGNFAVDMNKAIKNNKRTIAVLSETYLESAYTLPEWAAAFINDPTSEKHKLIPIKVKPCKPDGLLQGVVYRDLIGKSEAEARTALLSAVREGREKPYLKPSFPDKTPPEERRTQTPKTFPNVEVDQNTRINKDPFNIMSAPKNKLSRDESLILQSRLTNLLPEQLEQFINYVEPPKDIIPTSDSSPGKRVLKLIQWADSETGCGSESLRDSLDKFIGLITTNP